MRPLLHLTPARGWINDPLGLTWHDGRYHLFVQHVPDESRWRPDITWGHTTSDDLLTWGPVTTALRPEPPEVGAWSGSVVIDGEDTVLFYSSVGEEPSVARVRRAVPTDRSWSAWTPQDVVVDLPPGEQATAFRDPQIVKDPAGWRMIVGAGLHDGTAAAFTFASPDLVTWASDGLLARRHTSQTDPVWSGAGWECPQLVQVDGRWVLIVSVWEPDGGHDEVYAVGDLADGRFQPERWATLTYGPGLYAGSVFTDRDGRPGIIHWVRGVTSGSGTWAGALSLPHRLSLDGTTLVAEPHPTVDRLRAGPAVTVAPGPFALPRLADLVWSCTDGTLRLGGTTLTVTGEALAVTGRHQAAGTTTGQAAGPWTMPYDGQVRVIVDAPVLEVFTSGGVMALPWDPVGGATVTSGSLSLTELDPPTPGAHPPGGTASP